MDSGEVNMTTLRRIKPGDVIGVSLGKERIIIGLVLHVSTRFRGCMMVGFYDQIFNSIEAVDIRSLKGSFIDTPNYTHTYPVKKGPWIWIGHNPELLISVQVPELIVGYNLYYKDECVRKLEESDFKKYSVLSAAGQQYVENMLQKHFAGRSV
jgi:hypothetical protein